MVKAALYVPLIWVMDVACGGLPVTPNQLDHSSAPDAWNLPYQVKTSYKSGRQTEESGFDLGHTAHMAQLHRTCPQPMFIALSCNWDSALKAMVRCP